MCQLLEKFLLLLPTAVATRLEVGWLTVERKLNQMSIMLLFDWSVTVTLRDRRMHQTQANTACTSASLASLLVCHDVRWVRLCSDYDLTVASFFSHTGHHVRPTCGERVPSQRARDLRLPAGGLRLYVVGPCKR